MNDYTLQKFGRLTAIEPIGRDCNRNVLWRCVCDCGKETIVTAARLKKTRSCGCLHSDVTTARNTIHGQSHTKLYKVWAGMKQRCCNPHNKRYGDYGGRGVTLCEEWLAFEPFREWALASGYKEGLEIDRIENDLGYSPDNCRFTTSIKNNRNRRNNVILEFEGEKKTLSEWSEIRGLPHKALQKRLGRGWTVKEALTLPLGTKRKKLTPAELAS